MNLAKAALLSVLALSACASEKGVGFATPGGMSAEPPSAETTVISLPGVRPIPVYAAPGAASTAAAAAYGGGALNSPERNLVLSGGTRDALLRQIDMGGASYVVAQGGVPAALVVEIRTRTGCLVVPGWDTVPLSSGETAAVFTLDCS